MRRRDGFGLATKVVEKRVKSARMRLKSPQYAHLFEHGATAGLHTAPALREVIRGTSTGCAPAALRVHDHVSLHFPATDDWPRAAACLFEDQSTAHGR